jgi:hypothetical protein
MTKAIGLALIVTPFAGIAAVGVMAIGWQQTAMAFLMTTLIMASMFAGVYLIQLR